MNFQRISKPLILLAGGRRDRYSLTAHGRPWAADSAPSAATRATCMNASIAAGQPAWLVGSA